MRIGDLAAQAGVATSAVRFYESKGLIAADRRVAGQRRYAAAAVDRLRMIVLLRHAGLSISDIATASDRDPATAPARRGRAGIRVKELREQVLTTLSALVVVEHASHCDRDADDSSCITEISRRRDHVLAEAEKVLADIAGPAATPPVLPCVSDLR